jgi:hypothetical protein
MIALSIRQPWAHFIVHGAAGRFKDVENREWRTPFRGRCLIHASKSGTRRDFDAQVAGVAEALGVDLQWEFDEFPRGGVIGSVEIYDCVDSHDSPWWMGPHGFLLRDPRPTVFTPMPGRLGFFNVSGDQLAAITKPQGESVHA